MADSKPMMQVNMDTGYSGRLLVSPKDAATLVEIIGRAEYLHTHWDNKDTCIKPEVPENNFSVRTFSREDYEKILQAQVLGITYKELLEAENETESWTD